MAIFTDFENVISSCMTLKNHGELFYEKMITQFLLDESQLETKNGRAEEEKKNLNKKFFLNGLSF